MHAISDSHPPHSKEQPDSTLFGPVPQICAKEEYDGMVITTGHPGA